jgi:hypothetical protein
LKRLHEQPWRSSDKAPHGDRQDHTARRCHLGTPPLISNIQKSCLHAFSAAYPRQISEIPGAPLGRLEASLHSRSTIPRGFTWSTRVVTTPQDSPAIGLKSIGPNARQVR